MKTGIVIGKVWATKRLAELPTGALLEVALEEDNGSGERVIAYDPLGAGAGERVLITRDRWRGAGSRTRRQSSMR